MAAAVPGLRTQSLAFIRHFLEMCLSMCIGGAVLFVLAFVAGPAILGYPDPRIQQPEASLVAVSIMFALPMALWMRFRGMDWRPIVEMSAASIGVALMLIAMATLGVAPRAILAEFAGPALCGPVCAAMLVPMLARLDVYTGRHTLDAGHRRHTG